jgi:hypothetical protein
MSKARGLADLGNVYDDGALSNRNKIINGSMVIDQRNGGASVTPTAAGYSTVDRWRCTISAASKLSFQQSSTVPNNHNNSLAITSLSSYTVGSSDYFTLQQNIEGYNVADFGWGTSAAVDVTLSFWVRSSLTGTFGGCVQNSAGNRNHPFSYTINVANTWEKKTVTISGDTTGTWLTTNGNGASVGFALGVGSTFSGPAGAWSSTYYLGATGATSLVGTSGATFYLTGVQLEVGDTATPFEHRSYGDELAKCQRYFRSTAGGSSVIETAGRIKNSATAFEGFYSPMRAAPSVTYASAYSYVDNSNFPATSLVASYADGGRMYMVHGNSGKSVGDAGGVYISNLKLDAEL